MSAPGEPTTIRAVMERIRDRHHRYGASSECRCGKQWPCLDSGDAVAALAILDNAKREVGGGTTQYYTGNRLVSDPVQP